MQMRFVILSLLNKYMIMYVFSLWQKPVRWLQLKPRPLVHVSTIYGCTV